MSASVESCLQGGQIACNPIRNWKSNFQNFQTDMERQLLRYAGRVSNLSDEEGYVSRGATNLP